MAESARLREIDRELANLVRLAAKTGKVDEIADLCAELEAERIRIKSRVTSRPAPFPDMDRLRALAEERVLEIRSALEGSDTHRRTALRELLAGRRLQIGPDPERGFRVDGLLEVVLEATPPARETRTGGACGSGGPLSIKREGALRHPCSGVMARAEVGLIRPRGAPGMLLGDPAGSEGASKTTLHTRLTPSAHPIGYPSTPPQGLVTGPSLSQTSKHPYDVT